MIGRLRWRWQVLRRYIRHTRLKLIVALLASEPYRKDNIRDYDTFLDQVFVDNTNKEPESLKLDSWMHGNNQQPERLIAVAEYALEHWAGDILEIGAHKGRMTRLFAEVAQRYNRRVLVVDPWEVGTKNTDASVHGEFLKAISPYKEIVDVHRASSLDTSSIQMIKSRDIAFAFVDGLHTFEACLQDIVTVRDCTGYIAVDDVLWEFECEMATMRGAGIIGRTLVHHPLCREAYLLPKSSTST